MSLLKAKTKIRGRPIGSGTLRKPEDKASVPCRITPKMASFIDANKQPNERFSDTLERMFNFAELEHKQSRKKVDALEQRLQQIQGSSILQSKNRLLTFAN